MSEQAVACRSAKARQKALIIALILMGVAGWSNMNVAAPITFNTALPVAEGEFIAREQLIISQSGNDPGGSDRDRTAKAAVSILGYGVNNKVAVFGVLPYRDNVLKVTVAGQRQARTASGFGDLTVFGRYTLVKRDWPGRNFRVAPFGGIEAPTGEDDKRDAFGLLPASVQVGSGSWDPFGGVVLTYQTLNYQVDGQFSYKANNEANDFEAGDITRFDASLQYRLLPRKFSGGLPDFLYGVIEASWIHQQKNRLNGVADPDSGGARLFLTPGLQYVSKRWIAEAAVQLPVSQNLNGSALENDTIARLSVRFNF